MIEIVLAVIIGIILGIFTGIMPALHVNTVGIIIFSMSDKLLEYFDSLVISSFFVSIAITHAMIEFIPSLIFGIPNEDTVVSIQPGHRLLFEGKGKKAIRLVSFGGYLSIIIIILLLPILFIILPISYDLLKEHIGYLLVIVMFLMIYFTNPTKEKRFYSGLLFMASGILGYFVLNGNLSGNISLLVLLSGLFSVSTLIYSYNKDSMLPPQEDNKFIRIGTSFKKSVFAGSISGCVLGLLPGLGPAQATVIAQFLTLNKDIKAEDFIVTNSGVNISDTLFSLIAIYLISNPRSAISVYISQLISDITLMHIIFFIFISLFSVSVSCIISIKIGDWVINNVNNFNYRNINLLLICLITLIIIFYTLFNGGCLWYVLLCYVTSVALGLIPNYLDISKSNLMGLLIIPTIISYLF